MTAAETFDTFYATHEVNPIFNSATAMEILRLDNDNAAVENEVNILVGAIPRYLYDTTGYLPAVVEWPDGTLTANFSSLADAAAKYILWIWYYGENCDVSKMQRSLDHILAALRQPDASA